MKWDKKQSQTKYFNTKLSSSWAALSFESDKWFFSSCLKSQTGFQLKYSWFDFYLLSMKI